MIEFLMMCIIVGSVGVLVYCGLDAAKDEDS